MLTNRVRTNEKMRLKLIVSLVVVFGVGAASGYLFAYYGIDYANRVAADAYQMQAVEELKKGDNDGALFDAFMAIGKNPSLYSSYALIGDIYFKQDDKGRAASYYRAAIEASSRPQITVMGAKYPDLVNADRKLLESKLQRLN
jgi:Tfp pilus assembly protein PilF